MRKGNALQREAAPILDLDPVVAAEAAHEPFRYLVATGLLDRDALRRITADFPAVPGPGIYPLSELRYGPAFARLIEDIRGPRLTALLGEKFAVDLSGHPLMITVRGHCQAKDGRIHTDTETKVVTMLLYLNEGWNATGGRLRLLRGPDDIEDVIAEVPPEGGTLIAFRRSDNSFHGHKPYVGPRRYIMVNWMTDAAAAQRELARHRLSARMKRFLPFLQGMRGAEASG